MSKENQYADQLRELGIYNPAFDNAIHVLCIQERELSRAMKAWRATAASSKDSPSIADPLYAEISKLRRDILVRQDKLGLTPTGLRRLRKQNGVAESDAASGNGALAQILNGIRERNDDGTL